MAMATHTTAVNGTQASGLTLFAQALKRRFERFRLYRQTVNELSALSNHELADLGLHRSMIHQLARQATEENNVRKA